MRFTSTRGPLLDHVNDSFERAVEQTLDDARRAVRSKTGTFARSLRRGDTEHSGDQLRTVIGSPLASARVKERGGFMQAKKAKWLAIPQQDGSIRKVKSVRVPASPVVSVAGPRFLEYMLDQLRQR